MTARRLARGAEPAPAGVLERGLSERHRRPVRVTGVECEPLDTYSSHPVYRLRATLESGEPLIAIFKRLRRDADGREREVLLYRRLLAGRRFDAPELYAALYDEERDLYWLFLEDVGRWKLEWCEAEVWPAAFRWMARMHAECHGREEELLSLGCLLPHGPEFWRALAEEARRSLHERGTPRSLARFDALTGRYLGPAAEYLARRPKTLVHGDASCHNLNVQPGPRVRPIDWEWAAVGVAAWDVAKLLSGWGAEKPRLLAAYLEEFERRAPLDREGFYRDLEHCRALHRVWYLRWWVRGCEEPEFVERLLDGMEETWERLEEDV
ncbi:aminoglycoside phosphotransferase family protein [Rubrobacter taiwanensis]|jgi:hypothetical protein|uniref:Aminoglycoside phosphotransferase family protein n=1 Tax=Rubrobacter taiwanensis TaxID=185139 RepID=A0A4R1BSH4_9ACTN|nr:aminoglycoside phosphotransferase family protein [Rubrobacter taiwanensis]TCJ20783.1 aminoglycoside phosphotransferase family protein [Rubrobacter taiwanensis]